MKIEKRSIVVLVSVVVVMGAIAIWNILADSNIPQKYENPSAYSYEEYNELSDDEKMLFKESFTSDEAFNEWMNEKLSLPWKNGGKKPREYSYAEYEQLSDEQQLEFQNSFDSFEEFDEWLKNSLTENELQNEDKLPWEINEKKPDSYTYAEYDKLDDYQKIKFQESFNSFEEFDEWLRKALAQKDEKDWNVEAKAVEEYSYEEYQLLNDEQKLKFQARFSSFEEFDEWLRNALSEDEALPWEVDGRNPKDYTYEEYDSLKEEVQLAFQESFNSFEEFDEWLKNATNEYQSK